MLAGRQIAFDLERVIMKSEMAPFVVGAYSVEPMSFVIGAIVVIAAAGVLVGARREFAMFALFAGVIGVALTA